MAFRLVLPRRFANEMIAHAREALPNECCGLLAGKVVAVANDEQTARVECRFPLVNAAASPVEYLSEPRSMFEAVRTMRRLAIEVIAVYHSHPASAPVPSRTDLERSYSDRVINFIISLAQEPAEMRAWWLVGDRPLEAEWEIIE
jgi:[CysO sulfur-carrier protein]-S-L-cysteine hydrolase